MTSLVNFLLLEGGGLDAYKNIPFEGGEELKSCDVPNSPNRRSLFKPGMVIDSVFICLVPFSGNLAWINCQKHGACQKFVKTVSTCGKSKRSKIAFVTILDGWCSCETGVPFWWQGWGARWWGSAV